MAIVFLTTLAAQVGSACFNHYRSHKHAQKMAKIQREFEEKSVRDGINNARAEFAEMCALQREMERDMHQDRLKLIHKHHEDSLWSEAYRDALEKWPLLSPPYVIANAPLTLGHIDQTPIPLNCILTTSNDLKFNNVVFYKIEEELALFCSKYWNASTKKSIRFFQEMWRNNATDIGSRHRDIYALLRGIPTLVISPFFCNEKLLFKVYWWGLSTSNADDHVEEYTEFDPELTVSFPDKVQYSQEMIDTIIAECTPKLQAFISYFADLYYWNFYRATPTLPMLIQNSNILLKENERGEFITSYIRLIDDNLEHSDDFSIRSDINYLEAISDITSPAEFNKLLVKFNNKIKEIPILQAEEIIRISEFSHDFGFQSMNETIDKHLLEQVEEIEFIEDIESLEDDVIISFAIENYSDAIDASKFAFIEWTDNMYIGTYCDTEENICIYNESNTVRYFILRSNRYSPLESEIKNHILNIIPFHMTNKGSKPSGRERLGQRLIDLGQRLSKSNQQSTRAQQTMSVNAPWGENHEKPTHDLSTLVDFYIHGVNQGEIHFTQCGTDMGIADVLDWLDNLSDDQIGTSNQVYLIRGEYEAKNRILYCAFLAKDDKFDLLSAVKECFICKSESSEMKEAFAGKAIYIIPFE